MRELLTSLTWWLSVVVVGVLTSVLGGYLTRAIDAVGGHLSMAIRLRSARRAEDFERKVLKVMSDDHAFMLAIATETRWYFRSIQAVLFGILGVVLPVASRANSKLWAWPFDSRSKLFMDLSDATALFMAALALMISLHSLLQATTTRQVISEAQSRRQKVSRAGTPKNQSVLGGQVPRAEQHDA